MEATVKMVAMVTGHHSNGAEVRQLSACIPSVKAVMEATVKMVAMVTGRHSNGHHSNGAEVRQLSACIPLVKAMMEGDGRDGGNSDGSS